jgi:threonyl-tRNA synthetase
LIEHYAGAFPVWLAPVQVMILPITDAQHDYAFKIEKELIASGIRTKVDDRSEKIGFKIREAELQKIPYMIVVGEKESQASQISVRKRKKGDLGQYNIMQFIELIKQEIYQKVET